MENRFGLKDFILLVLIVVLIVVQLLQMKQRDLEQAEIRAIGESVRTQNEQIGNLMRSLSRGGGVAMNAAPTTSVASTQPGGPDPFKYIREAEQMPGYARGDWLVDNFGTKIGRITPLGSAADLYGANFQAKVQEGCAYRDPYTLEMVPLLAQSWSVSEDGLTIHVVLRHGLTFSDGQPLNADDIVWTFNWIMNPKVDAPRERSAYEKVESVTKVNDYEVVWKLKEPYFEALTLAVGTTVLPKHFYEKFTPDDFNKRPGLLLGSGPYKMRDPESWTPGQPIELVRNEFYWGEPGPWEKMIWKEVESEAVEMTMFRNGEMDIFRCQPEQYRLLMKDQAVLDKNNHFEVDSPKAGYGFIAWNQERNGKPTLWADKRVRQAMTMLTNRQAIVDQVFLGYASIVTGPFNRSSKQTDPNVKAWPFDPDKAKALLLAAGFKSNDQGVLLDPTGQPFRFKLTYPSKNETYERVVLLLKDGYARAGVVMDPDPQDWPIMLKKINDRDFEAIALGWSASVESDIYQEFHSSQIKDQGDDFTSYRNPELDKLIEKARSTVVEDQRMPLWQKCHAILHEDQPYTFLYTRKSTSFYDKRIQNVKTSKLGLNYVPDDSMPYPWFVLQGQWKWMK